MKYFRVALLLMGAVLLLVTAVGHWTALPKYEGAPPRTWERFDPNLADKLRSFSDLMEAAKYDLSVGSSEREIMDVLYEKGVMVISGVRRRPERVAYPAD